MSDYLRALAGRDSNEWDRADWLVVGVWLVVYVAAGFLIRRAFTLPWLLLGFAVFGVLVPLFVFHYYFRGYCDFGDRQSWKTGGLGLAAYVLGGTCIVGGAPRSATLTLVGTWIALLGLAAIVAGSRALSQAKPKPWAGAGLLIAFAALSAALTWDLADAALLSAVLTGVLGLVVATRGIRWLCEGDPRLWSIVGLTMLLVAGAALIAATEFTIDPAGWLVAVGLLLAGPLWGAIGLTILLVAAAVIAASGFTIDPAGWLVVFGLLLVLGLVFLSMGTPTLVQSRSSFGWVVVFVLGVLLGSLLTLSGELSLSQLGLALIVGLLVSFALVFGGLEFVVLLVLGVALATAVPDRPDPRATNAVSDGDLTLVAIGDSYMSGEGADRFLPGTNVKGKNECRRTSSAYPVIVAANLGWHLEFYACSGARTHHVLREPHQPNSPDSPVGKLAQIENDELIRLVDANPPKIGAVLISIGGNDAWFGAIGRACFAPGNCAVHRTTVLRNVEQIGDEIYEVYSKVKDLVGEDVPVVAMPYPFVFNEERCDDSPLDEEEHTFLLEFTEVLNDRARTSARQAGVNWFAEGIDAFQGFRICDTAKPKDAVVNRVDYNPQEGDLLDRINPMNWIHGSAHPKPRGHEMVAVALEVFLEDLIEREEANPKGVKGARFEIVNPTRIARVSTRLLAIPDDLACPLEDMPISGTSAVVAPNEAEKVYAAAMPDSPICYTLSDGTWSHRNAIVDAEGVARVPILEPESGFTQVAVYQSSSGAWRVRVLEFCEPDPHCAHDAEAIQVWTVRQITNTTGKAAIPAAIIFVGAWVVVVAVKRELLSRQSATSLFV